MPKKAAHPSIADLHAAPGGAAAVDRALSLLAVYRPGDAALTLAQLAERTHLYKSTVLRLLASLEHAHLLRRQADGRYALGPEVARLHAIYAAGFSLDDEVLPALQELADATGGCAAFQVRRGDQRLCQFRVDPPQGSRDPTHAGELLPLDRGAGGRVLLAFSESRGGIYEQIRRDGVVIINGDRLPELTGIAAPAFGVDGRIAGAVTLTLPTAALKPALAEAVRTAANRLTERLAGALADAMH